MECGSCETRFQVTAEVMAKNVGRMFPDEMKKKADLSGFARAPKQNIQASFQPAQYETAMKQNLIGPAPLGRTVAVVAGLVVLIGTLAIFYFGARSATGLLADFGSIQRLVLGSFFGLIGLVLTAWGMVKARFLGLLIGVGGALGIVALALFMPTQESFLSGLPVEDDGYIPLDERKIVPVDELTGENMPQDEVLQETRWKATVQPAMVAGRQGEVVGIWVRGMEEYLNIEIENYLRNTFDLPHKPDFRMLDDGGIFVMTGIPFDLEEVEARVGRFGSVEQVFPEMSLIQMSVNGEVLGQNAAAISSKLNDPTNEAFYSLNYNELKALDPARVQAAVKRLRLAPPAQLRKDITVRLVALLNDEQDAELYEDLAEALLVWSEPGDGADQVMVGITERMDAAGKKIPDGIISFLVQRKTPSAAPLLTTFWVESPGTLQGKLIDYGPSIADEVVAYLSSETPAISRSAAIILGEVATTDQLEVMREVLQGAVDSSFRNVLERSIRNVEARQ